MSATHVEFSSPRLCKRLSLEPHEGFKFTGLRDPQLTVQSSPTNFLEPPAQLTLFTLVRQR